MNSLIRKPKKKNSFFLFLFNSHSFSIAIPFSCFGHWVFASPISQFNNDQDAAALKWIYIIRMCNTCNLEMKLLPLSWTLYHRWCISRILLHIFFSIINNNWVTIFGIISKCDCVRYGDPMVDRFILFFLWSMYTIVHIHLLIYLLVDIVK